MLKSEPAPLKKGSRLFFVFMAQKTQPRVNIALQFRVNVFARNSAKQKLGKCVQNLLNRRIKGPGLFCCVMPLIKVATPLRVSLLASVSALFRANNNSTSVANSEASPEKVYMNLDTYGKSDRRYKRVIGGSMANILSGCAA